MPVQARRVFRLALTVALSLAFAYGLQLPLPFITPLFALMLTVTPGPPMGWKGLVGLVLVVSITLGSGLLLIPMLIHYPFSALLVATLGLYLSFYLTVKMGQAIVGALLTVGITMISAAGTLSFALAVTVVQSLVLGIAVAVACQWLVYPWFPESPDFAKPKPAQTGSAENSNWIALRGTLIVVPAYLLALTNPTAYMATIMKTVSLSQQSTLVDARAAGRELLGSTFLAGGFAVLFWALLGISTNLWMFFWWMLLFGIYFSCKIYRVIATRFSASFWLNVATTMLILLGPAVQDSDSGKDVYTAFFVRMGLFVAVTLYAWVALSVLEFLRKRRPSRRVAEAFL